MGVSVSVEPVGGNFKAVSNCADVVLADLLMLTVDVEREALLSAFDNPNQSLYRPSSLATPVLSNAERFEQGQEIVPP